MNNSVVVALDEWVARDLIAQGYFIPRQVFVIMRNNTQNLPLKKTENILVKLQRQHVWQLLALYNINVFISSDSKLISSIPEAWEHARVVRPTKSRKLQVLVGFDTPVPVCRFYTREHWPKLAREYGLLATSENVPLS